MRFSIIIITIISFLTIFVGTINAETSSRPLEGKKWVITSVGEHKGKHLGFIKFENGNLEGQSTCNLYSGTYELTTDQTIHINRIGYTRLMCKVGNKMEIENEFINGLEVAKSYKRDGDILILLKEDKTEIARFK